LLRKFVPNNRGLCSLFGSNCATIVQPDGSKYADVFAYSDVSTPHEGTSPRTCLAAGGSEGRISPLKLLSLSDAVLLRMSFNFSTKWSREGATLYSYSLQGHADIVFLSMQSQLARHEDLLRFMSSRRALMRHEGEQTREVPTLAHS